MQKPTRIVVTAFIGIGLGAGAAPVMAQNTSNTQQNYQTQKSSTQSTHFSDKTIHEYAKAQGKVRQIAGKWRGKIQSAKNKKTKKQYRSREDQELIKAVQKTGLSTQKYNKITTAARNNHKLAERIRNAQ